MGAWGDISWGLGSDRVDASGLPSTVYVANVAADPSLRKITRSGLPSVFLLVLSDGETMCIKTELVKISL